jgi:hypothetical protein
MHQEERSMSWRRSLGIVMMGLGGLFGIRQPPEPSVVAQMQPAKGPEGTGPLAPDSEDPAAPRVVRMPRKQSQERDE